MEKPTDQQIASSWELWQDYVDPQATMTKEQWDAMSFEQCLDMLHDCFGCDGTCEDDDEE